MTERKLTELLGSIDPALIAEAEAPVPATSKPRFRRTVIAIVAALLVLSTLLSVAAIAFFPKTYDLDYEIPKHENANKIAQIYYTEDGKIKRQSVLLPLTEQNVFLTWQHLNGLGAEHTLINVASAEENPADRQIVMTLSAALRDHPDLQSLLDSLQKTFAQYYDISEEQISFAFPDAVVLEFSHDLPTLPTRVYAGSALPLSVTLTNVSDHEIECAVMQWSTALRLDSTVYNEEMIYPTLSEDSKDITKVNLAPGQSKSLYYTFDLSKATPGTYDLELSFGEYSHTYANAVQILASNSTSVSADSFTQFLHTYGFDTADASAFKAAVEQLTYEGKGMFKIMSFVPGEYPEGFDGKDYASDLFTYFHFRDASQEHVTKYRSFYAASAMPDGMILPCGITTEHSLQEALLQIGFDKNTAEDLLAGKGTVLLFADGTHSLYLDYQQDTGCFAIQYKQGAALTSVSNAEYCLSLYYSPDYAYEYFTVQSSMELSTLEPARYVRYGGYKVNWTFTPEQTAWLQEVLDSAEWLNGLPLYTDYRFEPYIKIGNANVYYTEGYFVANNRYFEATSEQNAEMGRIKQDFPFFLNGPIQYWEQLAPGVEAEPFVRLFDSDDVGHMLIILNRSVWTQSSALTTPAYGLRVGSKECGYDPASGILTVDNSFTVLGGEDKQFVDAILTKSIYQPQFASIRLGGEDAGYAIPPSVATHLLSVLNTDDWYDGQITQTPELVLECDGTTVSYANGTFFTDSRYLYADSYTEDCTDALHVAMLNIRQSISDSVVYYKGEYYGHNDKVDQLYKDTVLPGGGGERLGDCANVVMGDVSLTDATMFAIEDGQNKALITDADGTTCFARFTYIAPDFRGGTCRMILADNITPCSSLTDEHQAVLRQIFENAEYYAYDSDSTGEDTEDFLFLSVFMINGYKIRYEAPTGRVMIGNWHAQLSEEDQRAVYNVISDFLPVG